jgi:hypothetical protein
MRAFFSNIWNFLVGVWYRLCAAAIKLDEFVRDFITVQLGILGICLVFFLIGYFGRVRGMIFFAGLASSAVVLLTWRCADVAVDLFAGLTKRPKLLGAITAPIKEELKKLLNPLKTIALLLAFVAAVVSIRGTNYYTPRELMIWVSFGFFIAIFVVWVDAKVTMIGHALLLILCYFMFVDFISPIQARGTLDWMEAHSIRRNIVRGDTIKDLEMVVLDNNTTLFESNGDNNFNALKDKANNNTVAKVVGRQDDKASKEPLYEVVIPNEGTYIGGKHYFVPARQTRPYMQAAQAVQGAPGKLPPPAEASSVPKRSSFSKELSVALQPRQVYTIDQVQAGQRFQYPAFNGHFEHRVDRGDGQACWKHVTNNLPWTADATGSLQVRAGNEPVNLTAGLM